MSGFPNYFEGQSVSSTASSKVEEPQQASFKKSDSLLDEDSGLNIAQKPAQNTKNILDFEAELQQAPIQSQPITKAQEEFSTMQMMFQTMNMSPSQQQGKPSVVIDNSEVDFFSSPEEEQKPSATQQGQIDFFSGMNTTPVNVTPLVSQTTQPETNFNTMQYMFATNQNPGMNLNNQVSFNTSSQIKSETPSLQQGWNTQTNNQPVGLNMGISLSTQPQQEVDASNFSTLQGLFATNAMGMNQPVSSMNSPVIQQQPVMQQQSQPPRQS